MKIIITVYTEKEECKKRVFISHFPHLKNKKRLTVKNIQAQCKKIRYTRYFISFIFIFVFLYKL
ncbi:hypothetical protein TPE_1684 [Treponema pedis str. T A4]|uniref:Uncharacterized protein n=1 Tax=Treponema pedis str. T A4 TaxID=1291379 RepID=S5ZNL1_9SPIR|nr:hypothetical protein TPE_1684 [Treponema pedis str. T A4]